VSAFLAMELALKSEVAAIGSILFLPINRINQ
jgi:hypothetical protein